LGNRIDEGQTADYDTLVKRVEALEEKQLTDVQRFSLSLTNAQCRSEYNALQKAIADVKAKREAAEEAQKGFADYKAESQGEAGGAISGDTNPLSLIGADSTGPVAEATRLAENVEKAAIEYRTALASLEELRKSIEERGCGYKEARVWVGNVGAMAGYNGDSAHGEVRASVLMPVGESGYLGVNLSGSPSGWAGKEEVDDGIEHELPGGLTQTSTQRDETTRVVGVEATAAYSLSDLIGFDARVSAGVGVAWMNERMERSSEVYGETVKMEGEESRLVGEASVGVSVKVVGPVRLDAKVRESTVGYNTVAGGISVDF
jgi:copper chaperone CopZ